MMLDSTLGPDPVCQCDRSAPGIEPAFCKSFFSSFFDQLVAAAVMCVFDYSRVHTLLIQISNSLILASFDCFQSRSEMG